MYHLAKYSALSVADYIVKKSFKDLDETKITMTNLRLQKLLYFVQLYFLSRYNAPCFSDTIEAWAYGPVVPTVYRTYCIFGAEIITPFENSSDDSIILDQDRQFIDEIIGLSNKYSTYNLVLKTHNQNPWKESYSNNSSHEITIDSLIAYISSCSNQEWGFIKDDY